MSSVSHGLSFLYVDGILHGFKRDLDVQSRDAADLDYIDDVSVTLTARLNVIASVAVANGDLNSN